MPDVPDDPRRFTRPTFVLIFAALLVYLAGNGQVPLWDRDEPRYAQCSRQMLQTGDWVLPRYLDEIRMAKPPLVYWLQAASMSAFGDYDYAARLPSAVAMTGVLLMVAVTVRRGLGSEHAFWTVLVLASSVMVVVAAKASLTDAVLLLFVAAAQLCLYAMWVGRATWPVVIVFGLSVGLALLTKGPVVLGVLAATLVGLGFLRWTLRWGRRGEGARGRGGEGEIEGRGVPGQALPFSGRTEGPLIGESNGAAQPTDSPRTQRSWGSILAKSAVALGLIAAVGLPWVILVEQRWSALPPAERERAASRGDRRKPSEKAEAARSGEPGLVAAARRGELGYAATAVVLEVLDRSARGHEGHSGPPGYYLAAIWPTFMPWSLVLPATLVLAWRRRHVPHVRFALAAVLGPWAMFEAVATKLPHYLLPAFVPLAVLAADTIVQCLRHGSAALSDKPFLRGAVVWGAILAALGFAPFLAARWFDGQPWPAMVLLAAVAVGYAAGVVTLMWRRQTQSALALTGVGGLLVFAVIFRFYLPACGFLRLAPDTAAVLVAAGADARGESVMLDYKEPSLAFYQGGTIREHSATIVTPRLLEIVPAEWFVLTRNVWDNSAPKDPGQPDARDQLEVVRTFRGLDVADGMRDVEVIVARRRATAGGPKPAADAGPRPASSPPGAARE